MTAAGPASPVFEVEGGSSAKRRLLLVSPLFPPAQGVGALRWQKMARYVAQRGWELDVITIHPECIDDPDWSRLTDLPPGTRLFGVRTTVVPVARIAERVWRWLRGSRPRLAAGSESGGEPAAGARRSGHPPSLARSEIRWTLTEPRAYVRAYNAWILYAALERWASDASTLARHVVAPGTHDAVISSGPPHAGHEAARRIARRAGLPFVMDMRDVWSLVQRCPESMASPLLPRLARRYESRALDQASLVIANTDAARAATIRAYPDVEGRIIAVMNGFDDDPLPATRRGSRFTIAYAGSIYLDRDPGCLFRAARQVIDELRLSPSQLALEFIGASDWSVSLAEMASAEGIAPFVRADDTLPRAQALAFLARAAMLVILPQDSDMAIPAKVFEYVRFEAWLLALVERGSATELVLRDTTADVVSPRDVDAIAAVIRTRYQEYVGGVKPSAIAADPRLSRRDQARVLLDALERQAMAARVPIVAADVGGVPDIVSTTHALLVPPEDPVALAEAVLDVYRDRAGAASRADAAHARLMSEFHPEPWIARYESLYRGIQRGRAAGQC